MKPRIFLLGWVRKIRVIGFSVAGSMLLATGAWAQVTFTVNTQDDGVDINPIDGVCSTVPPPAPPICTLRAAVMQANRMSNAGSIINLPPGTYTLIIPASLADGEENGDLNLAIPSGYYPGPTMIIGAGAATTTIDAHGVDRVLRVDAGRSVSITGVSMIDGLVQSYDGGGISNAGNLVLSDCIVRHNSAVFLNGHGGFGGGIVNLGVLQATRVTFSDNHASGNGGGIFVSTTGTLTLSRSTLSANTASSGGGIELDSNSDSPRASTLEFSTFADNTASYEGGGLVISGPSLAIASSTVSRNKAYFGGGLSAHGSLSITNSTISQNQASTHGGGIYNDGVAKVYNSTIAYNQADSDANGFGDGGGVWNLSDKIFEVHNTILAGNRLVFDNSNSDCYGFLVLYGVTGFEGGEQCSGVGSVIFIDSANELGTLKDNGGPTETIALLPPSTLIGNGAAEECNDANGHHLASDQRGNSRPPILQACDIGAFEYNELFRSAFDLPIP
jgi:predicted outer membrane repeat protein